MKPHEQALVVPETQLSDQVLPRLLQRVFHVTSRERLQSIYEAGFIKANPDGSLGNTYPQSVGSLGRAKGWVCLFDLRDQTDEALQWGLSCFYFLDPRRLGDDLAFLLLAPAVYPQLVMAGDIKSLIANGTFRIPKVECWFPRDMPLSAVEQVLLVHIVRQPKDPDGLDLARILTGDFNEDE